MGKSDDYQERTVKAKYIPIADNYKGTPLVVSVTGEGRRTKAVFHPGVWTECSVACAKVGLQRVKESSRQRRVQDGSNLERDMMGPGTKRDGGVSYVERDEGGSPDYEFLVDGNVN